MFCKGLCRKWKTWSNLYAEYERRGEAFVIIWYCKQCDTQVGETWLGQVEEVNHE